ncbi:MAG TPA: hypothetical protein VMR19_03840 [Candidatus Saccharimonadales bacterium]|nr:hypothetical protein [Candidatus Saccharimonadales bacterium]
MKNEHLHEQGQGKSWIGSFIASAIDQELLTKQPKDHSGRGGHCVNLRDMIIAPLVLEKIPDEILDHLRIDFISPKENNFTIGVNKDLDHIRETLIAEFGEEVVGRLKLSISDEKVRTLLH